MNWLSAPETEVELNKITFDISEFWAASRFLNSALYAKDFKVADAWTNVVKLTPQGEEAKSVLSKSLPSAGESEISFFLFRDFYQRALLVDCGSMKLDSVMELLRAIDSLKEARWPNVFGKEVYGKFNATYDGNRTEFLEAPSVERLLDGTPHGIFQLGNLICGPLGFLNSAERRYAPPTLKLPLWHCSDTGCGALHLVTARQHESAFTMFLRQSSRLLYDHFGQASEWADTLNRVARGGEPSRGKPFTDIIALLCDCVIGSELDKLFSRALRSAPGARAKAELTRFRELRGSPDEIVKNLTAQEKRQFLLLLGDRELSNFIDELIANRSIDIPPSEVRSPKTYAPRSKSSSYSSELSSLGIRSVRHAPVLRLHAEIWHAYKSLGILGDLSWRIRRSQADEAGLAIALMDYIRSQGPETAVRNLIFPSAAITSEIQEKAHFTLVSSDAEVDSIRKVLWKFGFSVSRYSKELQLLRGRIAEFKTAVLRMPTSPSEEDCGAVRAVGVNLFVSLEGFLEDLLAFNVWLLTSDHFAGTHFTFSKVDALQAVGKHLGKEVRSGDTVFFWNAGGENTLGSLLTYFEAFRKWLAALNSVDKSSLLRDTEDFPHYAKDPVRNFAFRHRQLWADSTPERIGEYASMIDNIYTQAAQADFASIRNGLDHKRDEGAFPSTDKMLGCASRLEQIVDLADHRSLIPKLIWPAKIERDAAGNSTLYLEDYKGAVSTIFGPTPVAGGAKQVFGLPYIAFPLNFLSLPNSDMLLNVSPKSEYSIYWADYPMRRYIPPRTTSPQVATPN